MVDHPQGPGTRDTALTEAAAKINEGNLRERLNHSGNGDELDMWLAEVFNAAMF